VTNLRFSSAKQVVEAFPVLGEELVSANLALEPYAFIDERVRDGKAREALAFCALLLPRREAVHWLCQALRDTPPAATGNDETLLKLAEDWVRTPSEAARRAAMDAGMEDRQKGACAWAALAAGWSGGSLSPNHEQPVPPPAHLTGHAVKVGLTLVCIRHPLAQQPKIYEEFVKSAVSLLKRGRA
jgi:hypothetical protein